MNPQHVDVPYSSPTSDVPNSSLNLVRGSSRLLNNEPAVFKDNMLSIPSVPEADGNGCGTAFRWEKFRIVVYAALSLLIVSTVLLLIIVTVVFSIGLTASLGPETHGRLISLKPALGSKYTAQDPEFLAGLPTLMSTEEAPTPLDLFEILDQGIHRARKIEDLYLRFEIQDQTMERSYKIAEMTRISRKASHELIISFLGSSDIVYVVPEGALLIAIQDRCLPIAVFYNPAVAEENNANFHSHSAEGGEDSTGGREEMHDQPTNLVEALKFCNQGFAADLWNSTTPVNGETEGPGNPQGGPYAEAGLRSLIPSRFGVSDGGPTTIFFNVKRIYAGGVADVWLKQLQVLPVRGRCIGTAFACTLDA